jgi:hypothetical protein
VAALPPPLPSLSLSLSLSFPIINEYFHDNRIDRRGAVKRRSALSRLGQFLRKALAPRHFFHLFIFCFFFFSLASRISRISRSPLSGNTEATKAGISGWPSTLTMEWLGVRMGTAHSDSHARESPIVKRVCVICLLDNLHNNRRASAGMRTAGG